MRITESFHQSMSSIRFQCIQGKGWIVRCIRSPYTVTLNLVLWFFLVGQIQHAYSQNIPEDSVNIIEKIVMDADTIVRYPVNIQQKWNALQDRSADSVLFPRQSTLFSKELFQLLIRSSQTQADSRKKPISNSGLFTKDGKIIRKIEFRSTDIFAPSVTDTMYYSTSRVEGALNTLHEETRNKILRRHLLQKAGDPLDVFLLSENERILRDLPFINDARFIAMSVPGSPDSVDLLLLTQDLFPLGFTAEITKSNAGNLSIWNHNAFGYGQQGMFMAYWDGNHKPLLGYGLSYGISSLAGSFTTARVDYIDRWNLNTIMVDVSRDFRSSRFRYAGGVLLQNTKARQEYVLKDTALVYENLKYSNADFWAGRMFRVRSRNKSMSSGLFITGRLNLFVNRSNPPSNDPYLYLYQDRTLLLFSAGISRRGFIKDNLIYTFGRTEDIPYGFRLAFTSGIETGRYNSRSYFSVCASAGKYGENSGYYYGQAKFGTFFNQGQMEQGVLQLRLQYFSRILNNGRYHFRNFVSMNYLNGINRFAGEFAGVEDKEGISGLTGESMRGDDKLVLNLESVVFSPFELLGFHFALFGSVDLGLISAKNMLQSGSHTFTGFHFGVRFKNEQLVFNTFELSLSFYPGMPSDGHGKYISAGSLIRSRFDDFYPYKPEIVKYQ